MDSACFTEFVQSHLLYIIYNCLQIYTDDYMRKVYMFMTLSLDGYFEGPNHDISWHKVDEDLTSL